MDLMCSFLGLLREVMTSAHEARLVEPRAAVELDEAAHQVREALTRAGIGVAR
jgi:hypothetical protein